MNVNNFININYIFCNFCNFTGKGLENWDVSNVIYMHHMFFVCTNFNCDLSNWDISNITDISFMFDDCLNFNCDLSKWNVKNVKYTNRMFTNCNSLKKLPTWYKK